MIVTLLVRDDGQAFTTSSLTSKVGPLAAFVQGAPTAAPGLAGSGRTLNFGKEDLTCCTHGQGARWRLPLW